jgi:ABC-type sugar transport system substrate-binding protein
MRHKTSRWAALAALAVALTIAFAATAFGASSQRQAGQALAGKRVGVIICTNQNPFCAAWSTSVKRGLERQGATVTVLSSIFDPAVDAQNMNRLIADKPDLIISVPASASAIVPSYIRAKRAGIAILGAIGRQSPAGAKLVTAEARTDDPALGRFAAQNVVEGMKKAGHTRGNVIALTGTASQHNVTDRMAAFRTYLKKFPQYKLVAVEDTNWDQATSAKVAQQLLSKYASQGGIQGAYGMADNMAIGIIQGATQAGVPLGVAKKGLVVTGSNCLSVGIKAIKAGQQYGTATQAPQVEAALAVKVATQILTGGKPPKVSYVREFRITKANVAKFTKICTF